VVSIHIAVGILVAGSHPELRSRTDVKKEATSNASVQLVNGWHLPHVDGHLISKAYMIAQNEYDDRAFFDEFMHLPSQTFCLPPAPSYPILTDARCWIWAAIKAGLVATEIG
jgi:hypothetical protein